MILLLQKRAVQFKVMELSSPTKPSVHERHQSLICDIPKPNKCSHSPLYAKIKKKHKQKSTVPTLSLKKHKTNTARSFREQNKAFLEVDHRTTVLTTQRILHRSFSASFIFQIRGTVSLNGILV
jgi:hypothetical protein